MSERTDAVRVTICDGEKTVTVTRCLHYLAVNKFGVKHKGKMLPVTIYRGVRMATVGTASDDGVSLSRL